MWLSSGPGHMYRTRETKHLQNNGLKYIFSLLCLHQISV